MPREEDSRNKEKNKIMPVKTQRWIDKNCIQDLRKTRPVATYGSQGRIATRKRNVYWDLKSK